MNTKLNIVGFDPSLSNWGVALGTLDIETMKVEITDLSVIQTDPEKDKKMRKVVRKNSEDLERSKILHNGVVEAMKDTFIAFVEVPVGSQSSRAMASYGVCIGVLATIASAMPVIQVTPTEVKMAGCGIKTATKEEMIEAMMNKYPTAPWPTKVVKGIVTPIFSKCEHMADAVAAIEAGIATDEFQATIAMFKSMPMFKRAFAA
ncbi:hypothetical protein QN372_00095 [Undibacterium sp. RTI2.1]|uniref:hypothetical protein n=1 Tax=unclassified Undibacterium TaxID=2630295 RepID=UPI002AB42C8F|nr:MULTISPECIES: hypothetical protein [unclassified Undibacterium]MDY7537540.1 hypothetical protein [Undibacterium sp. 5I1]MEB0029138.1 hypothetical protein [Undibacterium sp. RTI2.1]MEB0115446.1 hypothetical protein [Undibacterium sp. RTI2.2]MEB0231924.1 hypothetical protein [Undibacterium sp. 10I3]MEB0256275.1 hypothetical protein [Undibacterium sp. 5I1]